MNHITKARFPLSVRNAMTHTRDKSARCHWQLLALLASNWNTFYFSCEACFRLCRACVACVMLENGLKLLLFTIFTASPSSVSPLASSLTRSVFHSELKNWLFSKSFPPQTFSFPTGLITRTLGPSNDFTLLNGWICLHGLLD